MLKIALILAFIAGHQQAQAAGAFAYSLEDKDIWFVSSVYNKIGSKTDVEKAAIKACKDKGGQNCKAVKFTKNGCVAIAITNDGMNAEDGKGLTQEEAQQNAIKNCLAKTPNGGCIARRSFCDITGGFVPKGTKPPNFCRSWVDYKACIKKSPYGFSYDPAKAKEETENYCRQSFC